MTNLKNYAEKYKEVSQLIKSINVQVILLEAIIV